MCGIIGYVGNENAINFLHYGLKQLEYRGYDSAGVAFFEKEKIKTIKNVGKVDELFERINKKTYSKIGIGHTRWATNGKPTESNSHPHTSELGYITLVHNGIIENCDKIKTLYLKDVKFKSETDTEVIANLMEKIYLKTQNELAAIFEIQKILKGSYSLAILCKNQRDKIYFVKQKSALLVGLGKNENLISSDVLGFGKFAENFIDIEDGEFGWISSNNFEIFNKNFKKLTKKCKKTPKNLKNTAKNTYNHYMLKEIYEVPDAIFNTCELYKTNNPFKKINNSFFNNIDRIKLIACGTSYHACLVGEKLLRNIGYDATTEIASEFIYSKQVWQKNTLCIFVSQSGETADTLTAVKLAKKHKSKTLCITNVLTSSITKLCDVTLPIICGAEIAVASTKAYNGQICALIFLIEYLENLKIDHKTIKNNLEIEFILNQKNNKKLVKNTKKYNFLVKKMQKIAKNIKIEFFENQLKDLIDKILKAKNVFFVGKDFDYVLAMESALKLKEISYINAVAYASGELKHGTISLIDENTLTFAFLTQKKLVDKTLNVLNQIKARGGRIVLITPFVEALQQIDYDYKIVLPKIESKLYPLISIIPMQLLAYKTSVALGYDPDKPRNLAKSVTVE